MVQFKTPKNAVAGGESIQPQVIKTAEDPGMIPAATPIFAFDNDEKVKTIGINDLSCSIRRDSGLAGIRSVPTQFWHLYLAICTLLTNNGYNYTEDPVYVQNNSSKALLTDQDKADGFNGKYAPVNKWRFDKIIGSIHLPGIFAGENNDARNARIGISINKEGLIVGFGMNVHVCQNFNILGGNLLRSYTYGENESMPWDLMKFKLEQWIKNLNQIWKVENEIMDSMKSIAIPENSQLVEEIIGDLYIKAIRQAYYKGNMCPFDTHELSNFTKEMIQARKTEDRLASVWDIYNWGTSIMKPGIVDIGEIANNSNLWATYLLDRFGMNIPEAEFLNE